MLDQILQELYVGKTPELLEIERLIGKIRRSNTQATFFTNPTYSKDMEKINRLFEDFFGFEVFSLMIDRSTSQNAYTIPLSIAVDVAPQYRVKNNLLATDRGFKYKKEAGYCCIVHMYNNLFFDDKFTDSEILAIILHEIGHNFETVINQTLYYTSDSVSILRTVIKFIAYVMEHSDIKDILTHITALSIVEIITSTHFKKLSDAMTREIASDPNLRVIFGIAILYFDCVKEININIGYIRTEIMKYGKIPEILKKALLRKIGRPFGTTSENTADSFATIYGYGADLSSAMLKISTETNGPIIKKTIYNIPLLSQMVALYDLPLDIVCSILNEHPSSIERAKLAKANLQRELKASYLDPKMKAQIQRQINEIDDAVTKYENMSKRISNPRSFRALWDIFFYSLKGGAKMSDRKSKDIMGDVDKIFADVKLK